MLFWTRQFISTTFLLTLFLDMNHVPVAFGVWTKIDAGPFALLVLWFEKLKQCIYDTKNRRIDWAHKWTYLNSLNFIDVVKQVKNFYLEVCFITFFPQCVFGEITYVKHVHWQIQVVLKVISTLGTKRWICETTSWWNPMKVPKKDNPYLMQYDPTFGSIVGTK